jgi:hypothetical protein
MNTQISLKALLPMGLLALLAGCTQQSLEFTWYHPQGGEYLFAFDHDACVQRVRTQGHELGTDRRGPFFQCMRDRGYSLFQRYEGVIPGEESAVAVRSRAELLADGE